jgi:thymidylate synthase (FAD)
MKIIEQGHEILFLEDGETVMKRLEAAGRTAYKSEDKTTPESAAKFMHMLVHEKRHESVIEHCVMTVRFTCDRGLTHILVRHRLASFTQESTQYCNYSKDKFGNEVRFIKPAFYADTVKYGWWLKAMETAEEAYLGMIAAGASPQEARSVLPTSVKTELVMTANMREWRHIFKLRTSKADQLQVRQLMAPLLNEVKSRVPVLFDDIVAEA